MKRTSIAMLIGAAITALCCTLLLAACDEETATCDGPDGCCGTIYPGVEMIDPDNPVYSDSNFTQQEVEELFADAKADNDEQYRSYVVANEIGDTLMCAYCACGCAIGSDHQSAVDCFKDMHAFS